MKQEPAYLEDQLLVMNAQDGDARAMEELVRRWQKRLWQHAFRLTADPEAAWDITQQSWLGIIKGLGKLHDPEHFRAWAYQITTHKAVNWIKNRSREKHSAALPMEDPPQIRTEESGLRELLQKLDLKKRIVLMLFYFEELSVPEISTVLRIPSGTVKSRLHAGRTELKTLWQKENP
jgi:RNA polymerase sigma factor (sigma-70 family)